MENPNILINSQADVISLLFSFIIIDACDFNGFVKLLMVWERNQARSVVKDVLEKLDWDKLYDFHQHQMEVTREQFHGFIGYAVKLNVRQAMFYDLSKKLFMRVNVQQNLGVLCTLSGNHFPSNFSFLFFKAIYRPFELELTSQEMLKFINDLSLRRKLEELMNLLADIYNNIIIADSILPIYKFCPFARNKDPFYQIDGPPLHLDLWNSLCDKTVQDMDYADAGILGNNLTMEHIWKAKCSYCTLQLIVYKVLLNCPLY